MVPVIKSQTEFEKKIWAIPLSWFCLTVEWKTSFVFQIPIRMFAFTGQPWNSAVNYTQTHTSVRDVNVFTRHFYFVLTFGGTPCKWCCSPVALAHLQTQNQRLAFSRYRVLHRTRCVFHRRNPFGNPEYIVRHLNGSWKPVALQPK